MITQKSHQAWSALRAILENNFRFNDIKQIVGLGGLDLTHLMQFESKPNGGSSRGQLMTGIDKELSTFDDVNKQHFVSIVTEEILQRKPEIEEQLSQYLSRLGWTVVSGVIIPLQLFDPHELAELPLGPREELLKAAQRFRDGDLSGAISAACGAVDHVTTRIYSDQNLGDPSKATFQERSRKASMACGAISELELQLSQLGWTESDIKLFKNNFEGSLNQGVYIMQTLRSKMGDVHGTNLGV